MSTETQGHVLAFLKQHPQCWVTKRTKDSGTVVLTHTFIDGTCSGKLRVPPMLEDGFYAAIARDVQAGTMPALNELRTDVFNAFIDFDIALPLHLADVVTAEAVASVCVTQIARFFPTRRDVRCVVLTTPDKELPAVALHDKPRRKRGVHLYFPRVHVGIEEMLTMREAILVALARDLSAEIDWTEDFDNAPYRVVGGLRMLGAPKVTACALCNNAPRERDECVACLGKGKTCVRTQCYAFRTCLNALGQVDDEMTGFLTRNTNALVRVASVRATNAACVAPDWKPFAGCPAHAPLKTSKRGEPPAIGSKRRHYPEESASLRKWPKTTVTDPAKIACLRALFQTRFADVYQRVELSNVCYMAKTNSFYAQFAGEGENYCLNIRDRHKSNRVYGVVQGQYAYLRCHCNCATLEGRLRGVRCREFWSDKVRLTPKDLKVLDHCAPHGGAGASAPPSKKPMTSDDYLLHLSQTLEQANAMH